MVPNGNSANLAGDHGHGHGKPDLNILKDCNSEACMDAKAKLALARNEIMILCAKIRAKNVTFWMYLGLGMALTLIAIKLTMDAAIAAATIIGIPLSIILGGLAVIMYIAAVMAFASATVAGNELKRLRSQLEALRNEWNDKVLEVMNHCPESCWPDFDIPTCN